MRKWGDVAKYRGAMWIVVALITLVGAFGYTFFGGVAAALSEDTGSFIIIAALYAAPAVVATAISTYLWGSGQFAGNNWVWGIVCTCLIFLAASVLSLIAGVGLTTDPLVGLTPSNSNPLRPGAAGIVIFLIIAVIRTYANTYGAGLFFSALAIGAALGLEALERMEHHGAR